MDAFRNKAVDEGLQKMTGRLRVEGEHDKHVITNEGRENVEQGNVTLSRDR